MLNKKNMFKRFQKKIFLISGISTYSFANYCVLYASITSHSKFMSDLTEEKLFNYGINYNNRNLPNLETLYFALSACLFVF